MPSHAQPSLGIYLLNLNPKEEELIEKLSSAETLDELKEGIEKLEELIRLAKKAEKKEIETKLATLKIHSYNIAENTFKMVKFLYSFSIPIFPKKP